MWWYDVLGSVARSLIIYLGMVFLHLPVKIVEVLIIWRSLSGKSEFVWVRKVSSSCRVRRWTWLVSVEMIVWILQLFSCLFACWIDERRARIPSTWRSCPPLLRFCWCYVSVSFSSCLSFFCFHFVAESHALSSRYYKCGVGVACRKVSYCGKKQMSAEGLVARSRSVSCGWQASTG